MDGVLVVLADGLVHTLARFWPCLAYQEGKNIVFRILVEYSSLRDFGP
jgi:hypothetical protein